MRQCCSRVPVGSALDPVSLQDRLDVVQVLDVVVVLLAASAARAWPAGLPSSAGGPTPGPCPVRRSRGPHHAGRTQSPAATPATMMPSQTVGENTSLAAQLTTSSRIPASFRVPVSHAATGSSVQARPRIPAARPRRRQANQREPGAEDGQHERERRPGGVVDVVSAARGMAPAYEERRTRSARIARMRSIPDPGFAGDDGGVDPVVAAALAAYDRRGQADEPAAHHEALAVLQDARVLVPVVAILGEVEDDDQGLPREKSSDMAAVLMTGRDGRTALLAFTGTASLDRWAQSYAGAKPDRSRCRPARRPGGDPGRGRPARGRRRPGALRRRGRGPPSLAAGHRLLRARRRPLGLGAALSCIGGRRMCNRGPALYPCA